MSSPENKPLYDGNPSPEWDLSPFGYAGINDPKIINHLKYYGALCDQGIYFLDRLIKAERSVSSQVLEAVLQFDNWLYEISDRPLLYLDLLTYLDTSLGAEASRISSIAAAPANLWNNALQKFARSLPQEALDQAPADVRWFYEDLRRKKQLNPDELAIKSEAQNNISSQINEIANLFGQLRIVDPNTGEEDQLMNVYTKYCTQPMPPEWRIQIRERIGHKLGGIADKMAESFSNIWQNRYKLFKLRHSDPLNDILSKNNLSRKAYEAYIKAAQRNIDHEITTITTDPDGFLHPDYSGISVELAEVIERVNRLWERTDPEFGQILQKAYSSGQIQVARKEGHSLGAVYKGRMGIYLYFTWVNNWDSLTSLMHESAHLIHQHINYRSNPPYLAESTVILSETLAKFAEILMMRDILTQLTGREALLHRRRSAQIFYYDAYCMLAIHDFELACYEKVKQYEKPLSGEELSGIWHQSHEKWGVGYLSKPQFMRDKYWIIFNTLLSRGYRSFCYSMSYLLARLIYDKYEKAHADGNMADFASKLKKIFGMGWRHSLVDIFKVLDIDIENEEVWDEVFSRMREEVERLHEEVNVLTSPSGQN